tara:strand:- start:13 stop:495 length:483 start_codon:yes stop_codon:yes gene_type:complete
MRGRKMSRIGFLEAINQFCNGTGAKQNFALAKISRFMPRCSGANSYPGMTSVVSDGLAHAVEYAADSCVGCARLAGFRLLFGRLPIALGRVRLRNPAFGFAFEEGDHGVVFAGVLSIRLYASDGFVFDRTASERHRLQRGLTSCVFALFHKTALRIERAL